MNQVFDIVLPVFGLLGIGYAAAWIRLLGEAATDGLAAYVYRIAIPILVFRFVVTNDTPETSPLVLLGCYFGAVAIVWALSSAIARLGFGVRGPLNAIAGMGAAYSNSVLLGFPLIVASYGDAGALIFFILTPFHMPIMALALALHLEMSRGDQVAYAKVAIATFRSMAQNPIIIGIASGVLYKVSGLPLPGLANTISKSIGDTGLPCALFCMGLTLRRYGVREGLKLALLMTILKLLLLPALVWFFAHQIAGLDPVSVGALTIFAAAPAGVNVFIFASQYQVGIAQASSAIAISTALSIVTISVALAFLGVG